MPRLPVVWIPIHKGLNSPDGPNCLSPDFFFRNSEWLGLPVPLLGTERVLVLSIPPAKLIFQYPGLGWISSGVKLLKLDPSQSRKATPIKNHFYFFVCWTSRIIRCSGNSICSSPHLVSSVVRYEPKAFCQATHLQPNHYYKFTPYPPKLLRMKWKSRQTPGRCEETFVWDYKTRSSTPCILSLCV